MIYLCLLLIGVLGFAAQVGLGFLHGHGGAHGHDAHGHDAPAHDVGHSAHSGVAHAHHSDTHTSHGTHVRNDVGHAHDSERSSAASWLTWLSPMSIFSVALGAGVAGLMLKVVLGEPWLALSAFVTGVLLNLAVVRPLMGMLLQFASAPASALKGAVAKQAEVVSRFDERGRGVVRVNVDGQIVRLLAELENEDTSQAGTIRPGETLTVTSVDGKKNTCKVARM